MVGHRVVAQTSAKKHVTSRETCYVTSRETRYQQRNMLPAGKHINSPCYPNPPPSLSREMGYRHANNVSSRENDTSKEICYQQGNTLPAKKHVTSKETRDQQRKMLPAKKHVTSKETCYQQRNMLPAGKHVTSRETHCQQMNNLPAGNLLTSYISLQAQLSCVGTGSSSSKCLSKNVLSPDSLTCSYFGSIAQPLPDGMMVLELRLDLVPASSVVLCKALASSLVLRKGPVKP